MPVRYEYIGKPLGKTEYISMEEQRKQLQHRTVDTKARFILPANCDAKRILRHHCHRSCFAANIAAKYQREYEKHERHFRNEYFRPYSQRIFRTRCANFARWNSLRIAIRRKYEPGLRGTLKLKSIGHVLLLLWPFENRPFNTLSRDP